MTDPIHYSRHHPYLAKIKERFDLCGSCPEKETHHIVLDIAGSGITYQVGDCIGICPINDPYLIDITLTHLKADGSEEIEEVRTGEKTTLFDFLQNKANLSDINPKLLKEIAKRHHNSAKKQELEELLDPAHREQLKAYAYGRQVWDVLNQHSEVRFSPQEFTELLMPLLPRYYSIASSQKFHPDEIHLTVKRLWYDTHGYERKGVCTHYLCALTPVDEPAVPIFIQPHKGFTVPENPDAPIIMIGPGTGVAPFRAFMQERIACGAAGKNWLFFGEWRRQHNFLYGQFWTELEKQGLLDLDLAFSRDQDKKIYVQHKLQEQGRKLFQWIEEGAYLYVCGDAQQMAKDVESTLQAIIKEHGAMSDEAAREYLKALRKEKRYLRDVY